MREIKYRAWKPIGTPEMFTDVQGIDFKNGIAYLGYRLSSSTIRTDKERLENLVLMQYTGLKDRNGREIYEGDIVGYKWQAVRSELLVVEWSVSDGAYLFGGIRTDYAVKYGEVIGNIYENPELLEVAE